jgi:hypothetical protein
LKDIALDAGVSLMTESHAPCGTILRCPNRCRRKKTGDDSPVLRLDARVNYHPGLLLTSQNGSVTVYFLRRKNSTFLLAGTVTALLVPASTEGVPTPFQVPLFTLVAHCRP